jgi:hypothetical protein
MHMNARNISKIIKTVLMHFIPTSLWMGHTIHIEEMHAKFWLGSPKWSSYVGATGIDNWIILKLILEK